MGPPRMQRFCRSIFVRPDYPQQSKVVSEIETYEANFLILYEEFLHLRVTMIGDGGGGGVTLWYKQKKNTNTRVRQVMMSSIQYFGPRMTVNTRGINNQNELRKEKKPPK